MALYRTSLDIVLKNSRLFSAIAQKTGHSWLLRLKELPVSAVFQDTSKLNNEQWTNLRKEIGDIENLISKPSFDVNIIQLCATSKNLQLAKSYMEYLRENKYDLNTALIGKYLQLMYNCKEALTDVDKKEMLDMCDNLRLKYPLLDASTAESCILALSLTERWRETIELLDMVKISCNASTASYSAIIAAAFDNREPEMGWKYFHETVEYKRIPQSVAYMKYVEYCLKNFKKKSTCVQEMGKLFSYLAAHDLLPDETVMEHIKKTFETLKWKANFAKISDLGVCQNCDRTLAPLKLSKEDFSLLSQKVLDKVLVGDDIYHRSTPSEVKKFVNFVNKTKPYHVVLDGLNVGYGHKKHVLMTAAERLAFVVRYFLNQNQVILVLGRKHMLQWDKQHMNYIKNNSFLFLTDDLSSDDSCLLYATLASGPETNFVSDDLMRQHKFILQDVCLQRLFKLWQMSHQCFISFARGKPRVTTPLKFFPAAQEGENCWHIPYRLSDAPKTNSYEPPKNWLCLERKKRKTLV